MGGGREAPEGGDKYIPMADHADVWQKLTQYYKVIILQLKISNKTNSILGDRN